MHGLRGGNNRKARTYFGVEKGYGTAEFCQEGHSTELNHELLQIGVFLWSHVGDGIVQGKGPFGPRQ
jgi:hypothetical protein